MIYVLLDTNIILDMVVDRQNNINVDVIDNFIKLLDYEEIRLVVPEVVKTETIRHLDDEIDKVGDNIKKAEKEIKALYGLNFYNNESFDISEYKKNTVGELDNAYNKYQENKKNYKRKIQRVITKLFSHKNTIVIKDSDLSSQILHRRIHQRAPFHKPQKESYGDGAIIETLIHLGDYVTIHPNDEIYFVTRNDKDFSYTEKDKDCLHPDIVEDLQEAGIIDKVTYVRNFDKLVNYYLTSAIEEAGLKEEFIRYEADEKEEYYNELIDTERESVGLTPLSGFKEKLNEDLQTNEYPIEIVNLLGRINELYHENNGLSEILDDSKDMVINADAQAVFRVFASLVGLSGTYCTVEGILQILNYINGLRRKCLEIDDELPDTLSYGDEISFLDKDRNRYSLIFESLETIQPIHDGYDQLYVTLLKESEVIASGYIEVFYGYINEDEDGNIADGEEERIIYHDEGIVKTLSQICDEWEKHISEMQKKSTDIESRCQKL